MAIISVIVPVYNTEQFLPRCIQSILGQSYADMEIILIDDGSKDTSGLICDHFSDIDRRIRVIHTENKGVSAARNTGIDSAVGDYITFVDSDDWIDPDMYERMMQIAIEKDCDVVLCDCIKEDNERKRIYSHEIRSGYYNDAQLKKEYYPHLLMMENIEYPATISNWLMLYRVKQSNQACPAASVRYLEGIRYSEDLLFGAEIMLHAKSFYYMKDCAFYHYRLHENSATQRFIVDKWDDYMRLYAAIRERIVSMDYDFRSQMYKALLFFIYNAAGEIIRSRMLSTKKKTKLINRILTTEEVKRMFKEINILDLPIHWKQKVITALYKYKLTSLIALLDNRNR